MNQRKWSTTTVAEIRACQARGMSLRQIAEELNCSPQGLRQAYSLLEELQEPAPMSNISAIAHNPFGINRH